MKMFLKIIKLHHVSVRSKSSKFRTPAELNAIVRTKIENKKLFGKLLEGQNTKKKKKEPKKNIKNEKNVSANSPGIIKIRSSTESSSDMKNECLTVGINLDSKTHDIPEFDYKNLENLDEKTLLSVPLLNAKKRTYVIGNEAESMSIKKHVNYHKDYDSISTILSGSMSAESERNLQRWKSSMISKLGAEGFEVYSKNLMVQGSAFRKIILNYLKKNDSEQLKINTQFESYWNSLSSVFPLFPVIIETEGFVAHPYLKYKGLFDCLTTFKEEVVLVSWRKSDKHVATLERTFDIPIQLVGCMGALNFDDRYSFRVEQALIVMAYNDGSRADIFHLNKERCSQYWRDWLNRLHTFKIRQSEKNKNLVSEPAETENICAEKINVDIELDQVPKHNSFCGISIKSDRTFEDLELSGESALNHPLYNDEKDDFDPGKSSLIKLSEEFGNSYPSVTSILSESKSEDAKRVLDRWKQHMIQKLGLEGFELYHRNMLDSGSLLHEKIRIRLTEYNPNLDIPENIQGFWNSLSEVFPLISDVQDTESTVAHPFLKYRGIIDCIALFDKKLMLIDWKTSEKLKSSISTTYDAPLQIAAYIGAVNYDPSYPFKVTEGLIVVAYCDGTKAAIFHMNKEKCLKYWQKWLQRVNRYNVAAYEDGTKLRF